MSGYQYQENSSSVPPLSYNDRPMHAGMYAADLEHQAMQGAYTVNQPMFTAIDHPSSDPSMYYNRNYGHVNYYQQPYSEPDFTSYPSAGYAPGIPVQPSHNEPQNLVDTAPVPLNMMQGSQNIPQDFESNSSQAYYQNDNRYRGGSRSRGRGNDNNNRGYSKRGGYKQSQNFNSHGRNAEYYDDYEYDYNPGYRGNFRGQRGNQAMSFQNRHRQHNNDRGKPRDGNYSRDKQQYNSNVREGKEAKHSYHNGTMDLSGEKVKTPTSDLRSSNSSDIRSSDNTVGGQQNVSDKSRNRRGADASRSNQGGRYQRNGNPANSNRFESRNNSEGSKSYDNQGARPKYGRKFDPQTIVDKDESQRGSLTEQLSRNAYECMVCCEIIKVESATWSCQNCYHVFHLHCTKKWAHSSVDKETKVWRCPGCQNESTHIPSQYRCFCGKRKDPAYVRGETPHSCGEACRKKRKGHCKHPCTILCHPGPCPSCSSMVDQACDCGKERKSMRCSVAVSYKCENVCDKILHCGEHKCLDRCHTGDCEPCAVAKSQGCYCGRQERSVLCGTEEFEMISYSCEESCGKMLSCGNHVCEVACHPGECAPCSADPSALTTCCCGKTPLEELGAPERLSCLDPIPVCKNICNKPMACGPQHNHHLCKNQCHEGDCGPCKRHTSVSCQCGRMKKDFPCETAVTHGAKNPYKCQKKCGKKMNCGHHKCSDNCCVKDFHICEKICGAKLSCGVHKCKDVCHRGGCVRCLRTSFDELACYCGATVIEPPIPCGTKPPECRKLCTRPQKCEHPIRHYCHKEDECPLCAELMEKMCNGGHVVRKNIPCHMKNISCGMPCDKQLSCGKHRCQKICHKGTCLSEGGGCTQACTKPRTGCGHPCSSRCHKGDCPSTVCKTEIVVTCRCGNRSTKMECQMGGDHSAEIAQFQRLSVQSIADSSGGEGVDMAQFSQTKSGSRKLDCDTSCAQLERNKRVSLALEIMNPDVSAKLGNPTFTDFLKEFGKKYPAFATTVEKALGNLVQTAKKSLHQNRSHSFSSMNRDQRRFVHELAEFYGCQTKSYDFEPNRNVVSTAYRDKCWLPNLTLTQLLSKDPAPKAPPPLSSFKSQGVKFTVLGDKKKPPSSEPQQAAPPSVWETVSYAKSSKSSPQRKVESKPTAAPTVDYFDFTEN